MKRVFLLAFMMVLAACEPQATPLPAYIPPTDTPTPVPVTLQPVRYGLMPDTPENLPDLQAISETAQVTWMDAPPAPEALGLHYDVIAGYGERSGWTLAPITPHVSLVINPALAPLDDTALLETIRHVVEPQALVTMLGIPGAQADSAETLPLADLRGALANAGWPDGFDLAASSLVIPGAVPLELQFQRFSIRVEFREADAESLAAALDTNQLHLALVTWTTPEERQTWVALVGDDNVIDLYTLPISYLATDGVTISFTAGGWPLASR